MGLSSYSGCFTGSSLVPTITRAADEELLAEPHPASSPPAAAAPAISLSASRRDIRGRQIGLSLGWNAIAINLLSGPSDAPVLTPRRRAPAALARQGQSPTPWPPHPYTS